MNQNIQSLMPMTTLEEAVFAAEFIRAKAELVTLRRENATLNAIVLAAQAVMDLRQGLQP